MFPYTWAREYTHLQVKFPTQICLKASTNLAMLFARGIGAACLVGLDTVLVIMAVVVELMECFFRSFETLLVGSSSHICLWSLCLLVSGPREHHVDMSCNAAASNLLIEAPSS